MESSSSSESVQKKTDDKQNKIKKFASDNKKIILGFVLVVFIIVIVFVAVKNSDKFSPKLSTFLSNQPRSDSHADPTNFSMELEFEKLKTRQAKTLKSLNKL